MLRTVEQRFRSTVLFDAFARRCLPLLIHPRAPYVIRDIIDELIDDVSIRVIRIARRE